MASVLNKRSHSLGPGDVYIGRPGPWGNPFSHLDVAGTTKCRSRTEAVVRYKGWLWAQIQAGNVTLDALASLHGKNLVCWCAPLSCHGDVLMAAAAWATDQINGNPR